MQYNNGHDTDTDDETNIPYEIYKTSDGIEINYYLNKPIEYLPPDTNIIVFSEKFNQPVDNLPNQVDTIYFGSDFDKPVNDLPNGLKYIFFAQSFNHPIDNLPDSVEEIRVSQFYSCVINKLPKSLKLFNVVHKTKTTFGEITILGFREECVQYVNEPHDKYYQMYAELEERFPHVQFIY
jgi:hypothetical protein